MSAAKAVAADAATDVVPVKASKKRLLILAAAGLALLLAAGGGAAFYLVKQRAAAAAQQAEEDGAEVADEEPAQAQLAKADLKHAPTFVPLDPFTVNLADRESERYAQVGITLELVDAKAADLLKAYMPAIRHNILLALGSKTAGQLIERDGKLRLAAEVRREALRPLGYEIAAPPAPAASAASGAAAPPRARAVAADADADDESVPIRAVHFSNFIIQ